MQKKETIIAKQSLDESQETMLTISQDLSVNPKFEAPHFWIKQKINLENIFCFKDRLSNGI